MRLELPYGADLTIRILSVAFVITSACTVATPIDNDPRTEESDSPSTDDDEASDESDDDGHSGGSTHTDAAVSRDAGSKSDAGSKGDAGQGTDANTPSQPTRDSGTTRPSDASVPSRDGGTRADAGSGSDAGTGGGDDALASVRQQCVDEINMYRATKGLPALARATAQESCSDEGARVDSTSGPHASSGRCFPRKAQAQNSCPGWPVRGTDTSAVWSSLQQCLKQMWAEGEPPNGRAACQADSKGCYQKHGHYLNMTSTDLRQVACGLYKMPNGSWYMNQDFGS